MTDSSKFFLKCRMDFQQNNSKVWKFNPRLKLWCNSFVYSVYYLPNGEPWLSGRNKKLYIFLKMTLVEEHRFPTTLYIWFFDSAACYVTRSFCEVVNHSVYIILANEFVRLECRHLATWDFAFRSPAHCLKFQWQKSVGFGFNILHTRRFIYFANKVTSQHSLAPSLTFF